MKNPIDSLQFVLNLAKFAQKVGNKMTIFRYVHENDEETFDRVIEEYYEILKIIGPVDRYETSSSKLKKLLETKDLIER